MRASYAVLSLTLLPLAIAPANAETDWLKEGKAAIEHRLQARSFPDKAKNVILFIGDGMGISTITAGRIFDGQSRGESGEENSLSFETFPHLALSKTYNSDAQTPDSAGTATAILSGSKTRKGMLGLSPAQPFDQCAGSETQQLFSLIELAEDVGLATGVVTTTRLTHATPAAAYAHVANRDWEDDSELSDEARQQGCADIAQQFIEFNHGDGIDVAMGGGRRHFLPRTSADPEFDGKTGRRADGRNLIAEWQAKYPAGTFVWNAAQFAKVDASQSTKLLGLFNDSHMAYETDRAGDKGGEPSLAEMTEKAIDILEAKDKGYVLLVEGGRIDHAHHGGNARRALKDTQALSQAVSAALKKVDLEETLIIVTADHSHVFTMAGYPKRGNPILGLVHAPGSDEPTLALDNKPYTTLGYQNGPGAFSGERADLSTVDVQATGFQQQAVVPSESETHGGEDVAIFATGAGSQLVSGVMEQNIIFHVMHHALRESVTQKNRE